MWWTPQIDETATADPQEEQIKWGGWVLIGFSGNLT